MNISEAGIEGFGESSTAELAELRKALDIGYTLPGTGNDAIRVESLESTLKVLTYSAQHMRLWNTVPKLDAYSTVEEYNRLVSYGADQGGFVASGQLPQEDDTTYQRANQLVKYVGTTRGVNHPATLVRTVPADLIAQEIQNGILWMLGKINSALYFGDSTTIPLEWNGFIQQIVSGGGTVVDLRAGGMSQSAIENAAEIIIENYGIPSYLYSNPKVFADFSKNYQSLQRFNQPIAVPGVAGVPVTSYQTMAGKIDFQPDLFVKLGAAPLSTLPNSTNAPNTPTLATSNLGATTGSLFGTGDADFYAWQVTALNQYGESAPSTFVSAQQDITSGEAAQLTVTDGGGSFPATAYKIYRTQVGNVGVGPTMYVGYRVARTQVNGAYQPTTVWTDLNAYMPGTYSGLMLDMTTQSLAFKQLSPLVKMDLAQIAPSIRWMQLLYGTPIVYAPAKNVVFRNIGIVTP